MGKKKQSVASWRKRGAPLEEESRRVRQKRDQELRTGGSIAEVGDDELFSLEPTADASAEPSGRRRGAARSTQPKQLWVDKVVAPNPHIKPVMKAPSRSEARPERSTLALRAKIGKARKRASITAALAVARPPAAEPSVEERLDIWGSGSSTAAGVVAQRVPQACRRGTQRRLPEPSTEAAAVQLPAQGASWNPTLEDHQKLLAVATEHELERQRKAKVHRPEGLFGKVSDDLVHVDGKWIVRAARARVKATEEAAKAAKAARQREKQVGRVGQLLSEIKEEDKRRAVKRQEEVEWEAKRPRKLGEKRHEVRRPDVLLTEEQPSSLRQLTAEGSLLADRFDSLRARNLIEVRDQKHRPHGDFRRRKRTVLREGSKDTKYKSPFGVAGPLPAWL